MKTIDDYCERMDYRFGVAKEPWKQVVQFYTQNVSIGYGLILGPQGFILTSESVANRCNQSDRDFRNAIAINKEGKQFTLDNTFYQSGSGLVIVRTETSVEEAARIGLDSSFYHHVADTLPIVPGDKELNDLFWYGYHSTGAEVVSSMGGVDTLFHAYTFDSSSIKINAKTILYDDIENIEGYVHHHGLRLFILDSLGPLEEKTSGMIYEGPFFTGLCLDNSKIGTPVFVRDTVDYDDKSYTPGSEQQPKLYLVGIVDKGAKLRKNINEGYSTPVCRVVRAGSREIKKLLGAKTDKERNQDFLKRFRRKRD